MSATQEETPEPEPEQEHIEAACPRKPKPMRRPTDDSYYAPNGEPNPAWYIAKTQVMSQMRKLVDRGKQFGEPFSNHEGFPFPFLRKNSRKRLLHYPIKAGQSEPVNWGVDKPVGPLRSVFYEDKPMVFAIIYHDNEKSETDGGSSRFTMAKRNSRRKDKGEEVLQDAEKSSDFVKRKRSASEDPEGCSGPEARKRTRKIKELKKRKESREPKKPDEPKKLKPGQRVAAYEAGLDISKEVKVI